MHNLIKLIAGSVFFICVACSTTSQEKMGQINKQVFGTDFEMQNVLSYEQLYAKMKTKEEITAQVKGRVSAVCQAKGCWMNIVSDKLEEDQSMFVKFKDYGFFMPLDIAGREVVMHGKAYKEVTSVDELRHYAEDEGKSKEEIALITQPVEELKFMADGVILLKEN